MLLDVDRGEHVVLDHALREDDRVLVVVTLPRHERDQQVATERHLGILGARTVGQRRALLDPLPGLDQRPLVDAGALVGAAELAQPEDLVGAVVVRDLDQIGTHRGDGAGLGRDGHVAGVHRAAVLHAGAHERGLRQDQRHGLALHVRAHQRAVTRRRARGTGSSRSRPRPSAAARRPCTGSRRRDGVRSRRAGGGPARAPRRTCPWRRAWRSPGRSCSGPLRRR